VARSIRFFPALGALILCGGVLASCGDSVPGNAVAKVGNVTISKAAFNHWLTVAQNSAAASSPGAAKPAPLDPPNYTACVAYHQRTDPKPPKGQPNTTPAQLKSLCAQQYGAARDQVVPFLVTADWLQGEAADQGVKTTDAEVAKMLKTIEAQRFPTPAQLQQFLTSSGETTADLLFRVRIDTLSNKLRQKVTGAKVTITPADISTYYAKNASRFGSAETRDLRIVLVKTAAQAAHVRALLGAGQSIAKVAKQFSVDQATKAQGGALIGVVRGQQDKTLDAAIFSAPLGRLTGPVKTPFGYEIFRVQKITPAKKQTLAQATPLIRQLITAQRQQDTLTSFVKHFEAKWRSRTICAKGYVVSDCKNGPKPSATPAPAGGTAQQGTGTAQQGTTQAPTPTP
jgi:foldase protein PrsA